MVWNSCSLTVWNIFKNINRSSRARNIYVKPFFLKSVQRHEIYINIHENINKVFNSMQYLQKSMKKYVQRHELFIIKHIKVVLIRNRIYVKKKWKRCSTVHVWNIYDITWKRCFTVWHIYIYIMKHKTVLKGFKYMYM